jgi:hypothetical protein
MRTNTDDDLAMPFGKYRGEPLSEIPADYLRWVLREVDALEPWLGEGIRAELQRREQRGRASSPPPRRQQAADQAPRIGWDAVLKRGSPAWP